jgi:hypothetical protein
VLFLRVGAVVFVAIDQADIRSCVDTIGHPFCYSSNSLGDFGGRVKRIERYAPGLMLVFGWYLSDAVGQTVPVPQASPEVIAYRLDQDVLWVVGQTLGLAVPIFLLFTGYAAKAAKRFQVLTRGRMWASWSVMAAAYLALTAVIDLLLRFIGRSLAASAGDRVRPPEPKPASVVGMGNRRRTRRRTRVLAGGAVDDNLSAHYRDRLAVYGEHYQYGLPRTYSGKCDWHTAR